jgi:sugar phosphate isomerase/epimerase
MWKLSVKLNHDRNGASFPKEKHAAETDQAIKQEVLAVTSRRAFLAVGAGALAAFAAEKRTTPRICIFSKHLQWLSIKDAAALAAEAGYDGIDLTVRDGGHITPARVADDLPKAVEAVRKAGLDLPMITSGIVDARSPHAELVLRTASALNIRHYRWGGFSLDASKSIPQQIEDDKQRVRDLAALNHQFGECAMYHSHSGAGVLGASIWDLYLLLKDFDPNRVGVNFDIGHATIEGGLGGWINSASLVAPMMRGVALKDFYWEKTANGNWEPRWCPIGQGMVKFVPFFEFLRRKNFAGPIQLHFEYPEMAGANDGKPTIGISRKEFTDAVRRDLNSTRALMVQAGLVHS